MTELALVKGFHPIFRKKAASVETVDDGVRAQVARMFEILYGARGVGIGANMVGLLRRIIVIDLQDGGARRPLALINPDIIWLSEETQTHAEASLCWPGVSADVTRPAAIRVAYLDAAGAARELEAAGWLAQVIQHEVDYLDWVIFPDRLPKVKRDMVMRKIRKIKAPGR